MGAGAAWVGQRGKHSGVVVRGGSVQSSCNPPPVACCHLSRVLPAATLRGVLCCAAQHAASWLTCASPAACLCRLQTPPVGEKPSLMTFREVRRVGG